MKLLLLLLYVTFVMTGCKSLNKMKAGTLIGTAGGEMMGSVIGTASGNTDAGASIGATMGAVTGGVVGNSMDKQISEIKSAIAVAKVERVGDAIRVECNNKILFRASRSEISETAAKSLDELSRIFQKYQDSNIELEGYTNKEGFDGRNRTLAGKRANSIAQYLKSKGTRIFRIEEL